MEKKRVYRKPVMESETFVPSAYCNVCYQVACNVWENPPQGEEGWDENHWGNKDYIHRKDHCGDPENQVITVNDAGVVTSMTEVGTDGLGKLDCNILSPLNFKPGMPVKWTTTAGNRTWTHHGFVQAVSERNPGMS